MIGRTNVGGGGGGQTWSIRGWCETVGLSYGLLDDITEADMRTLMTKYASVAYFREWYASEPSMIDQFIANIYAMKWIGLRDYICDKLMAVSDFKTKALANANWEYILKDHVPVMTSDTAPYGEVFASSNHRDYPIYQTFDGNNATLWVTNSIKTNSYVGYKFTNPICVKKFFLLPYMASACRVKNYYIEASNDGTNWIRLYTGVYSDSKTNGETVSISNDNYYLQYRIFVVDGYSSAESISILTLQFYGRSLNVSVPKMTSNTAPYGQVSANGDDGGNNSAYSAFNDNGYAWVYRSQSVWIQYQFVRAFRPKFYYIKNAGGNFALTKASLLGSNDGSSWTTLSEINFSGAYSEAFGIISTDSDYKYLRITSNNTGSSGGGLARVNFFGVDYSERTDRTYLYDHGLYMNGVTSFQNVTVTQTSPYQYSDVAEIHNNPQSVSISYSTSNASFVVTSTKLNNKVQFGNDNWLFVASENTSLGRPEYHIGNTPEIEGSKVSAKTVNNLVEGLDISQISGQYYIDFRIYGRNDLGKINIDITEIWLE